MNCFSRQRFIRKYHLGYKLKDGRIWKGFINICVKNPNDFVGIPKGTFWISKDEEGWHGGFRLDDESYIEPVCPSIVTTAVYMAEDEFDKITDEILNQSEGEYHTLNDIFGLLNISSGDLIIPRFEARIEDCFMSIEPMEIK